MLFSEPLLADAPYNLPPRILPRQSAQLRLHGRQLERDDEALAAQRLSIGFGGGDAFGGQPLEFLLAELNGFRASRGHEVAAEFLRECGQALVDVGEAGLAGGVEIRALALEGPQEVVVETVAFRVVVKRRCLLDARVEHLVLVDRVIVRG